MLTFNALICYLNYSKSPNFKKKKHKKKKIALYFNVAIDFPRTHRLQPCVIDCQQSDPVKDIDNQ